MNYLKDQSCDQMQGYYFSRPIVPEQFADLLRKQAANNVHIGLDTKSQKLDTMVT